MRSERGMGEGELSQGGSWMGSSRGDSTKALYDVTEDIGSMNLERGGADQMASCHCWR